MYIPMQQHLLTAQIYTVNVSIVLTLEYKREEKEEEKTTHSI